MDCFNYYSYFFQLVLSCVCVCVFGNFVVSIFSVSFSVAIFFSVITSSDFFFCVCSSEHSFVSPPFLPFGFSRCSNSGVFIGISVAVGEFPIAIVLFYPDIICVTP